MTPNHTKHFAKALTHIPWATQTNAKRYRTEWDPMPPFIARAEGCRIWDLDGKPYIDYRCALGPIILGYRHPVVDEAVRQQMERGVLFSMASPIELEAAEAVIDLSGWADQVHFMKTGNDACNATVRLARSYTTRDHILSCGYHGFGDWFTLNWLHSGVPAALHEYVHEVAYGDTAAVSEIFDRFGDKLACAIIEPYDWGEKSDRDFVALIRDLCHRSGALLIFDEVLTGFRLAPGGAAEYYAIEPDLAAYAKAMANGYPLSAFAGKKEYMQRLNETVLTTTYAGETLSLAACKATLDLIKNEEVLPHIHSMGNRLRLGLAEIIAESGAPARVAGLDPAPYVAFNLSDSENIRYLDLLYANLYELGIFANVRWFINYAHQPADIDETLDKFRQAMRAIF